MQIADLFAIRVFVHLKSLAILLKNSYQFLIIIRLIRGVAGPLIIMSCTRVWH